MIHRVKFQKLTYTLILLIMSTAYAFAQSSFKDFGYKGGFQINGVMPTTEFESDNGLSLSSYLLKGFLRFELSKDFQAELNAGYGKISGDGGSYYKPSSQYEASIIPIEARILYTPFEMENWNPYFYAGVGLLNYSVTKKPVAVSISPVAANGWTGVLPIGIGTEVRLSEQIALDFSVGYNYSLTENLNHFKIPNTTNDGYLNIGVGLSFTGENLSSDNDGDGLSKKDEMSYLTDPGNPDTDGDGLKDGDEILRHKTNPLKIDTDGDGLNDYDEVVKYKTDPLIVDTDGDGLYDGEEVAKYRTNPLKPDTDAGTVNDGQEVKKGTNPLDSGDDVPRPVVVKEESPKPVVTEVEKELTFDFVYFAFNKSTLSKEAKVILDNAYEVLSKYPGAKIRLMGHTDSKGSDNYNQKLSDKRTAAVEKYLVDKGISTSQISAEGFGKTKPVAPNASAADRAKNRRTEITSKVIEKK